MAEERTLMPEQAGCGQPFWADPYATLYQGDCRAVLAQLPADSIQMCVTSPPFWGLRKYEGPQEMSWGDWAGAYGLEPTPEMYVEHTIEILRAIRRVLRPDGVVFWHIADSYFATGIRKNNFATWEVKYGTMGPMDSESRQAASVEKRQEVCDGLKPKDLCLIPERVMLAAEADGWWVRSRIAWVKPNPMPESVRDRPTDAWDYIIMFTKSANYYWDMEAVREGLSPLTLVDKRNATGRHTYQDSKWEEQDKPSWYRAKTFVNPQMGRNLRDVWTMATEGFGLEMCQKCGRIYEPRLFKMLAQKPGSRKCRCRKDDYEASPGDWVEALVEEEAELLGEPLVMETGGLACAACGEVYTLEAWEKLETGQVKVCRCGASDFLSHFATFPLELPTKCILAATSEKGNCPKCGKPWVREVKKERPPDEVYTNTRLPDDDLVHRGVNRKGSRKGAGQKLQNWLNEHPTQTLGWQPSCSCLGEDNQPLAPIPALVIDPFAGSGTTLVAAKRLGRRGIGIDLSPQYLKLAQYRLERESLPLQDLSGDFSTQFPFPNAHPPDILPEKGE